MNVLEMEEEVESLVGSNKKKISNGSTRPGPASNAMALVFRKNFLTYIVAFAVVAIVALFYVSVNDDGGGGGGLDVATKAPHSAPVALPVAAPPVETPKTPTANNSENPPPIDQSSPVTPPPTDPPQPKPTPPPTDPPQSSPTPEGAKKPPRGPEVNLYSKFATYEPLPDPPMPNKEISGKLADQWGKWSFWDGDEEMRPTDDFMSQYPYRDVPGDEIPDDAWQAEAVFVNHYLNDADKLVSRAIEAIFAEYGHAAEGLAPEELSKRNEQFHWEILEDMASAKTPPAPYGGKRSPKDTGGWTTQRSSLGMQRRLLHAMMTSDTFTVVMGGHSASAGEGNHFEQSYMMQFHQIMAPIFARLGVKLITRNFGMGGLGTVHNGLGSGSIYGDEVDLLIWDSGMTEREGEAHDVFVRQALMGGNRVPVIWTFGMNFNILQNAHENADADVGGLGSAMRGIPETTSDEQAKTLPWAVRYLHCSAEMKDACRREKYCTQCWKDREDGVTPAEKQVDNPKGQVSWHPGWRSHQLTGRNIAMAVLRNLQSAITTWTENVMAGPPLADEYWHVTEYYENIRSKVRNMDKSLGACYAYEKRGLPGRICNTPLKALTHYQPRAKYVDGAINAHVKPAENGYIPTKTKSNLFEGPAPHNPCFDIPEGEVDVYAVVSGRRRLAVGSVDNNMLNRHAGDLRHLQRNLTSAVSPGKGWEIWGENSGLCDGTYASGCQREGQCVLQGQQAGRGAIVGNEYSGWLVMNLEGLKEGIIMVKLHTWHTPEESTITKDWTTVNNERRLRDGFVRDITSHSERSLGVRSTDTPALPDTMAFEFAIDGKISTLPRDEFLNATKRIQRVVEIVTLLDDPSFTSEPKDVEVALRMTGCGRECTFGLTHIYWA